MADGTAIEWTDATWNPATGCTKVTRGCDNCYVERIAEQWRGKPGHPYEQGFDLRLWPSRLDQPSRWRKPRMVFVTSMSDLFHERIDRSFVDGVFETMESADRHIYQVLTKRSSLMKDYLRSRYAGTEVPKHIWCGVSVEDESCFFRIQHLRETPASVRFLSLEPLLAPVGNLQLHGISWVIVGGESGPNYRPIKADWVRDIRDRCEREGVPFFLKQWGGRTPRSGGRMLDNRTHDEMPWDGAKK